MTPIKSFPTIIILLFLLVFPHNATAMDYTYDALNRLTRVIYDNGDSITYNYDPAGNITGTTTTIISVPSISIIAPNGGESLQAGSIQPISWNYRPGDGSLTSAFKIDLYQNGVDFQTIAITNDPTANFFDWEVPLTLENRNDYQIKISAIAVDGSVIASCISDAFFSITSDPSVLSSITINGPSEVEENSTTNYTATARYSDGSTSNVTASAVWSEQSPFATINAGLLSTSSVSSDSSVTLSATYTVSGITKTATKTVLIKNQVIPPSITVTTPNNGESWPAGSTQTIHWDTSSTAGSHVIIELYRGEFMSETITSSTVNNGSYSWTIPASLEVLSNYRVKITSTSNPSCTDFSDTFFSITPHQTTVLQNLVISGPAELMENSSATYTATAIYSDGSISIVTALTHWSTTSNYGTISQRGVLSTTSINTDVALTINATYTYNGITKSRSKSIRILNFVPGKFSITPILKILLSGAASTSNGIVNYNGIMWQKSDDNITRNWEDAIAYCENLELEGYEDWRLPTKDELKDLVVCTNNIPTPLEDNDFCGTAVDNSYSKPTIDSSFMAKEDYYWSSDTYDSNKAWGVAFSNGYAHWVYKDAEKYVRCRR